MYALEVSPPSFLPESRVQPVHYEHSLIDKAAITRPSGASFVLKTALFFLLQLRYISLEGLRNSNKSNMLGDSSLRMLKFNQRKSDSNTLNRKLKGSNVNTSLQLKDVFWLQSSKNSQVVFNVKLNMYSDFIILIGLEINTSYLIKFARG